MICGICCVASAGQCCLLPLLLLRAVTRYSSIVPSIFATALSQLLQGFAIRGGAEQRKEKGRADMASVEFPLIRCEERRNRRTTFAALNSLGKSLQSKCMSVDCCQQQVCLSKGARSKLPT